MYEFDIAPEAVEHLKQLTAGQRRLVADAIENSLRHQPAEAARNRKRMRAKPLAQWCLRVREHRVYYEVNEDESTVSIVAVGIKERADVLIDGESQCL